MFGQPIFSDWQNTNNINKRIILDNLDDLIKMIDLKMNKVNVRWFGRYDICKQIKAAYDFIEKYNIDIITIKKIGHLYVLSWIMNRKHPDVLLKEHTMYAIQELILNKRGV